MLAEIAHIEGDRPGSPRYNDAMTDEKRQAFDNLILLCPNHHQLVDYLEPEAFSVEILRAMKERSLENRDMSGWPPADGELGQIAGAIVAKLAALDGFYNRVEVFPDTAGAYATAHFTTTFGGSAVADMGHSAGAEGTDVSVSDSDNLAVRDEESSLTVSPESTRSGEPTLPSPVSE